MPVYVDTLIKSTDEALIFDFCSHFQNVIGPVPCELSDPQIGDLGSWYANIRTYDNALPVLPEGIVPADEETCLILLGVWARGE